MHCILLVLSQTPQQYSYHGSVCTIGHVFQSHRKYITHVEVTLTLWEFIYGEKTNMADETAVKFESKLRRGDDSTKAFDSAAS